MEITTRLLEVINDYTGINVVVKSRKREIVEMRSLYFDILKDLEPNKTFSSIGESVNVDHSTVMHSLSKYKMYEKFSPSLKGIRKKVIANFREGELEEIEVVYKEVKETVIKKLQFEIIEQLNQLLIDTQGTEKNFLIQLRLEAFYDMNKIKTEGWYSEEKEARMNIIGQNGNDGQHYK
jgi:hypothetical protein